MTLEDDEVGTVTGETTETEEKTVEEQTEETAETAGADGEKTEEKLPKDAPEWAVKRFGKLTAKRHEAEEARAQAETERDQYKTEAETAKAKYGDRDILLTAKRTGILPELLTKDEAATLSQAERLERDVESLEAALEDNPDGWEANGQTVTAATARGWLRKAKSDLKEIADEAAQLRKAKADEVRELIRLGKKAKAEAGSRRTEDGIRKTEAGDRKPVVKAKPTQGASQTTAQGGARRAVTEAPGKSGGELSKVKTQGDMLEYLTRKHGG